MWKYWKSFDTIPEYLRTARHSKLAESFSLNRDNYVVASQESAVPYLSLTFDFTTKASLKIIIATMMIEKLQPCLRCFRLNRSVHSHRHLTTSLRLNVLSILIPYLFIFNINLVSQHLSYRAIKSRTKKLSNITHLYIVYTYTYTTLKLILLWTTSPHPGTNDYYKITRFIFP